MKKIFLFILFCFCYCYAFSEEQKEKIIYIDMNNDLLEDLLGKPQKISVEEFEQNNDWDTIIYDYTDVIVYMYRIVNSLNRVYISSTDYLLKIDEITIHCGLQKTDIEKFFGKGYFNNHDERKNTYIYLYEFTNSRELYCYYNSDDILIAVLYGYCNPE